MLAAIVESLSGAVARLNERRRLAAQGAELQLGVNKDTVFLPLQQRSRGNESLRARARMKLLAGANEIPSSCRGRSCCGAGMSAACWLRGAGSELLVAGQQD